MTLWTPDTCGCQIEFDPHPDDPNNKILHLKTHFVCPKHEHLAHTQGHADTVLAHNQAKNIALATVAKHLGIPEDQQHEMVGKYNPDAPHHSDPLTIVGHGKTGAEMQAIQAHVDATFGPGKVIIAGEN
jgi:hypothetical protein